MTNHFITNPTTAPTAGIIFYDGSCGICNGFVQFVLRNEHTEQYQFSALQSPFAANSLSEEQCKNGNSIVLLQDGKIYTKSGAVFTIMGKLRKPWCYCKRLLILPLALRDWGYDLVAGIRHRLHKNKTCSIHDRPDPKRFLHSI